MEQDAPYYMSERELRATALSFANSTDQSPEDVVRRAGIYLTFLTENLQNAEIGA